MISIMPGSPVPRYALAAVLLAAAAPGAAQTYDPLFDQATSPNATSSTRATTDARTSTPSSQANDASTTQNQATDRQQRFAPDQIETTRRTNDDVVDRNSDETSTSRDRRTTNRADNENFRRVRPAEPSEFEKFASDVVDRPLRRFGTTLLVPEARDFTAPSTTTVPPDYRLNPGDVLSVGVTGSAQAGDLRLTVDADGRVFLPRVGAVTVGGVRYRDVQGVLTAALARQYRDFQVAVSVHQLHGITVYVTGFAQTPGSYTVSSLSTLVNAVLAAGGPASGGSFRTIELRRGGRLISAFDLYDFLLKGDKSADAILQNGDVIFVAPAGPQVAVIGSVNNEAIFEARQGDSLSDVLRYAGGLSTVADDTRLLVLDPLDVAGGWQLVTPDVAARQIARRAEVVRVLSGLGIAKPLARQPVLVTVSGEVAKPGRFYLPPGTSLAAAIAEAGGLTPDAYAFGAVLTRETLRQQQRLAYDRALRDAEYLLTVQPLTSALSTDAGQVSRLQSLRSVVGQLEQRKPDGRLVLESAPDATTIPGGLTLENNDTLYVPPVPVTVGVFGAVPSPASFGFVRGRTVGDYVAQAGGVQKIGDRRQIVVVRANGTVAAARHGRLLRQPVLPGDLVFVPLNASRGEFFARLATVSSILLSGAIAGATVAAVSK